MNRKVTIINKSDFPTAYLNTVVDFAVANHELSYPLTIIFKRNKHNYSGTACENQITVRLGRHWVPRSRWPEIYADSRISFGHPIYIPSRTALIVFLLGHELSHVSDWFHGRRDAFSVREFRANDHGEALVKKYLAVRERLWPTMLYRVRQERKLEQEKQQRDVAKDATARSPEFKRGQVQKKLEQWQRRLKLAQSKVRKYKQKVMYYDKKIIKLEVSL